MFLSTKFLLLQRQMMVCISRKLSKLSKNSKAQEEESFQIYCEKKELFLLFPQFFVAFNPLPVNKILDRSKLKQSADDNFKFDDNSRKFYKRVENTVG